MSSSYLVERPNTHTAPPADDRMSKAQRWVPWTLKHVPGKPKPSKFPIGKTNDPTTWTFFHAARTTLEDAKIAGLGFQMFGRPGVIAIDVDNCLGHGSSATRSPRSFWRSSKRPAASTTWRSRHRARVCASSPVRRLCPSMTS
jgi:hypothetical protein